MGGLDAGAWSPGAAGSLAGGPEFEGDPRLVRCDCEHFYSLWSLSLAPPKRGHLVKRVAANARDECSRCVPQEAPRATAVQSFEGITLPFNLSALTFGRIFTKSLQGVLLPRSL